MGRDPRAGGGLAKSAGSGACGEAAFTGTSTFKHTLSIAGGGGGSVYELDGQCTACSHIIAILEMR